MDGVAGGAVAGAVLHPGEGGEDVLLAGLVEGVGEGDRLLHVDVVVGRAVDDEELRAELRGVGERGGRLVARRRSPSGASCSARCRSSRSTSSGSPARRRRRPSRASGARVAAVSVM